MIPLQYTTRVIKHLYKISSHVNSTKRQYSGKSQSLIQEEFGDPLKVVKMIDVELDDIDHKQVLLKMLAVPINPADINTIHGSYGIKPSLPHVPGYDGVAKVLKVGASVQGLQTDDWVIPRTLSSGTCRTHMLASPENLIKIPSDMDKVSAATFAVNPGTAYRMLHDFKSLQEGDVVIQNGANSAVGQAVIQIAAAMGLQTINIVRDRPEINELKQYLSSLGATLVLTDEEVRSSTAIKQMSKPALALNCVSGKSGTEILRHLAIGGVMVTYGGMSRQPVTVPIGSLIFSDISIRGFWMSRWNTKHFDRPERQHMLNELYSLVKKKLLIPPSHTLVPFERFKEALENTLSAQGKWGVGSTQNDVET